MISFFFFFFNNLGKGKNFCVGLDVKEMRDNPERMLEMVQDLPKQILKMSKPMIAAVNGAAITGGFELALACDMMSKTFVL